MDLIYVGTNQHKNIFLISFPSRKEYTKYKYLFNIVNTTCFVSEFTFLLNNSAKN